MGYKNLSARAASLMETIFADPGHNEAFRLDLTLALYLPPRYAWATPNAKHYQQADYGSNVLKLLDELQRLMGHLDINY